MRVLYDHQVFSLQDEGGISRYYFELTKALDQLALSFCDVALGLHRNRYPFASGPHTRVLERRSRFAGSPGLTRYGVNHVILDIVTPFRGVYDIYHPTFYRWLGLVRYRKMVVTHHDCAYERFPSLFRRSAQMINARARQFDKADAIICPSESTRNDLHHFYEIPESKTFVVHHGVATLPCAISEARALRDRPFLLYVGSRAPYKNFLGFLSAFHAAGLRSSFDVVAIGGGPAKRNELEQIARDNLVGYVHFVPDATDEILASYYRDARLLVYPSLYEGFGFPPLEAMQAGCPVLSSNVSCLPDICGSAAAYFEPASDGALAEALKLCCHDDDWRRKAVAAGEHQARRYSWSNCARSTFSVYEAVR